MKFNHRTIRQNLFGIIAIIYGGIIFINSELSNNELFMKWLLSSFIFIWLFIILIDEINDWIKK